MSLALMGIALLSPLADKGNIRGIPWDQLIMTLRAPILAYLMDSGNWTIYREIFQSGDRGRLVAI